MKHYSRIFQKVAEMGSQMRHSMFGTTDLVGVVTGPTDAGPPHLLGPVTVTG